MNAEDSRRNIGLVGATLIGVGAIVGMHVDLDHPGVGVEALEQPAPEQRSTAPQIG